MDGSPAVSTSSGSRSSRVQPIAASNGSMSGREASCSPRSRRARLLAVTPARAASSSPARPRASRSSRRRWPTARLCLGGRREVGRVRRVREQANPRRGDDDYLVGTWHGDLVGAPSEPDPLDRAIVGQQQPLPRQAGAGAVLEDSYEVRRLPGHPNQALVPIPVPRRLIGCQRGLLGFNAFQAARRARRCRVTNTRASRGSGSPVSTLMSRKETWASPPGQRTLQCGR
jgi:hypothetical protein